MARLTAARRRALPLRKFALPGRRYPIDTRNRAANALVRAAQHATPAERSKIQRAVCRRFPDFPSCKR